MTCKDLVYIENFQNENFGENINLESYVVYFNEAVVLGFTEFKKAFDRIIVPFCPMFILLTIYLL